MPTTTKVEKFEKATTTKGDIDDERQMRLDAGAISSTITEDSKYWYLTTVREVL